MINLTDQVTKLINEQARQIETDEAVLNIAPIMADNGEDGMSKFVEIRNWAEERNLIKGSNPQAQMQRIPIWTIAT